MLAAAGAVALTVGGVGQPSPSLSLSVGAVPTSTPDDLPDLLVPSDSTPDETTTTAARPATTVKAGATTTTSVKAPATTPTTTARVADPTRAVVLAVNRTQFDVKMWVGDVSEHEAWLSPGESVEWRVTPSDRNPDAAGAVAKDSYCGGKWFDQNNLVAGHLYTVEARPGGFCANGFSMPILHLKDDTTGAEKSFVDGLIPDANHALIYVVNKFSAQVKIAINDDSSHEWTLVPGEWGTTTSLKTSNEHGDGATITRLDLQCGYGDGHEYFQGGHTYRLEAVAGQKCHEGSDGPNLMIHDLTSRTTRSLDPAIAVLPRSG